MKMGAISGFLKGGKKTSRKVTFVKMDPICYSHYCNYRNRAEQGRYRPARTLL